MVSINHGEMRGKKGANMLNCVATLVGQEQFYFFLLLLNNGYRVFSYHGNVKGPISCDSWELSVVPYLSHLPHLKSRFPLVYGLYLGDYG